MLSGIVSVGAATMGVNGSPFGNAAFTPALATTTGTLSGFSGYGGGEGVSYRLDAATALTGSPSAVGTNGSAAITSLWRFRRARATERIRSMRSVTPLTSPHRRAPES